MAKKLKINAVLRHLLLTGPSWHSAKNWQFVNYLPEWSVFNGEHDEKIENLVYKTLYLFFTIFYLIDNLFFLL